MSGFASLRVEWGEVTFLGQKFKDLIITPRSYREWDWTETHTSHARGTPVQDVAKLLTSKTRQLFVSSGFHQRLRLGDGVRQLCKQRNIALTYLNSDALVGALRQHQTARKGVVVLLHSTC